MKKKTIYIIISILTVFSIIAYYLIMEMFAAPLYNPGDLTKKTEYSHLLDEANKKDIANFFTLNNGISLHYFTKGEGKPILIVHGGPGIPNQTAWKGLDSLTKDYKFYYYDQRGCGKSTRLYNTFESDNFYQNMLKLNINLGLPAQIADIEQIRRKIGVEKLTIIGHSFGGFIASLYAIEFPDKVEKLILTAPADVVKLPSETGGLYGAIEKRLPADKLKEYNSYLNEILNYDNIFEKPAALILPTKVLPI